MREYRGATYLSFSDNDFFKILSENLKSLKTKSQKDEKLKRTLKVSTIEKGQDEIYGYLNMGGYGRKADVVNSDTGKSKSKIAKKDSPEYRYFYYFYIPEDGEIAICILHSYGVHGTKSTFEKLLNKELVLSEYRLDFKKQSILFEARNLGMFNESINLKGITIEEREKLPLTESNGKSSKHKDSKKTIYYRPPKGTTYFPINKFLKEEDPGEAVKSKIQSFFGLEEEQMENVKGTFIVGGIEQTLSISQALKFNTKINVTEEFEDASIDLWNNNTSSTFKDDIANVCIELAISKLE